MAKIRIDMDQLCAAYPEAKKLEVLPRKKKKALKKKISKWLISVMTANAFEIFLENSVFNETYDSLKTEMERVSSELRKTENDQNV
jgi:hypothetical protein